MSSLDVQDNCYTSPVNKLSLFARIFPSIHFYLGFIVLVLNSARCAKRGAYDDEVWRLGSLQVLRMLEKIGVCFEITGLEHLKDLEGPCVIVGNHMSIMETLVLPAIVLPYGPVTYVVIESLLNYPVFKYVMRSRNPVAVTRTNPREDFKTVMSQGPEKLAQGTSIIVFPQTTRADGFDPETFWIYWDKACPKKADVTGCPCGIENRCLEKWKYL